MALTIPFDPSGLPPAVVNAFDDLIVRLQVQFAKFDFATKVALPFFANNMSAAVDLNAASGNVNRYVMPFAGSIVGLGVRMTGERTAGSIEFTPQVNGTAPQPAMTVTINAGNTQTNYGTSAKGILAFNAGDAIGVTTAFNGFTPTTSDADVIVIVEMSTGADER